MMKKLYLWLYAIMLFTGLYACSYLSDDDGDPDAPYDINISIRDAETHENLLGNGDKLYHIDSLKLYTSNNTQHYIQIKEYNRQVGDAYFDEYFFSLIFDNFHSWCAFHQSYGEEFDTTLLLYYHQFDTDTIRIKFSEENGPTIYKNEILLKELDTVPTTTILPKTKKEQELSNQ